MNTTVPWNVPTDLGANVTETVHEPVGLRLAPQVLVFRKDPVAEMSVMVSAAAPVFVNVTVWAGGGHEKPSLHEKVRLAGMSCTVPFVKVMATLLDFVASVMEAAFTVTLVFDGNVAGPLKLENVPLGVLAGFIVPHPGEQFVPL